MPLHKNASTGLFNLLRNSPVRNLVWPIRSFELVKFVPMALLMFAILLSYNIVRAIKDALIMTKIAPEVISFIKLWIEMPAGILIVLLYSVLCNKLSTKTKTARDSKSSSCLYKSHFLFVCLFVCLSFKYAPKHFKVQTNYTKLIGPN